MQASQKQQFDSQSSNNLRPVDFSFVNNNNSQIINSLQQEIKRPSHKKIAQNTQFRGYQMTFKKPDETKFDYTSIKRLQKFSASISQKMKTPEGQQENQSQNMEYVQSYSQNKQIAPSTSHKKTQISFTQSRLTQKKYSQQQQAEPQQKMVTKKISKINLAANKKDFAQLNILLPNVYEDEVLIRRGSQDPKKLFMNVCGNQSINFQKTKFQFNGVSKVKIYPQKQKGKCFKLKVVHNKVEYFLAVQLRRDLYYLPKHYVWFAKLVNSKLMHMKYKIEIKDGNKLVDTNYGLGGVFAEGMIYKRSKYQKKWQKRYVVINTQGVFSYINQSDHYTISIPTEQIEELWTNFQVIYNHLVIKLAYSKRKKIEFAIPIQDYCLREESNWLFAFYRVLMEHTIHIKCICG